MAPRVFNLIYFSLLIYYGFLFEEDVSPHSSALFIAAAGRHQLEIRLEMTVL